MNAAWTAVLAQSSAGTWVSLDPGGAPRLVEEALRRSMLPSLAGLHVVRREIPVGSSRIDLLLAGGLLCEVKSVGAQRDGIALFPDAPTLRGLRHLAVLARRARRGLAAGLVLCAQRGDVRAIAADHEIDPAFSRALRAARRAGVAVAGLACAAHADGMEILGPVPVL